MVTFWKNFNIMQNIRISEISIDDFENVLVCYAVELTVEKVLQLNKEVAYENDSERQSPNHSVHSRE